MKFDKCIHLTNLFHWQDAHCCHDNYRFLCVWSQSTFPHTLVPRQPPGSQATTDHSPSLHSRWAFSRVSQRWKDVSGIFCSAHSLGIHPWCCVCQYLLSPPLPSSIPLCRYILLAGCAARNMQIFVWMYVYISYVVKHPGVGSLGHMVSVRLIL